MKLSRGEGRGWGNERERREREEILRSDVCRGPLVFLTSYSVENQTEEDDINKIIMIRLNNPLSLSMNLPRT